MNVICTTDGTPTMIGRHRGFIQHMKTRNNGNSLHNSSPAFGS